MITGTMPVGALTPLTATAGNDGYLMKFDPATGDPVRAMGIVTGPGNQSVIGLQVMADGTLYIGVSSNRAEGRRARACLGVVTFATPPCIVAHLPNQFPPKHTAGHNLGRYGDHRRHHSPENRRQHPACQTRSQLDPSLGEQHRPHQPK